MTYDKACEGVVPRNRVPRGQAPPTRTAGALPATPRPKSRSRRGPERGRVLECPLAPRTQFFSPHAVKLDGAAGGPGREAAGVTRTRPHGLPRYPLESRLFRRCRRPQGDHTLEGMIRRPWEEEGCQ